MTMYQDYWADKERPDQPPMSKNSTPLLAERSWTIFTRHIYENASIKTIADDYGLTRERIRQIVSKESRRARFFQTR